MAPSLLETFPNRVDQPVWNRHRKVRERLEGQAARGWCIERERYSQSSGGRSRQEQSGSGSAVLLWCMLSACSDGSSNSDDSSAAPAGMAAGQPVVAPDPVKGVSRTVVLDGLQQPWDIAFSPEGTMLYTQRARGLSVRLTDGARRLLYAPPDLLAEGQSGALGIALDKGFSTNRTIYLSSHAGGACATDTPILDTLNACARSRWDSMARFMSVLMDVRAATRFGDCSRNNLAAPACRPHCERRDHARSAASS